MSALSKDMEMLAGVIGEEATLKLMCKLGGVSIYIPKPGTGDILVHLRSNALDAKVTAVEMGVSLSKVYRVLKEYRESRTDKRQLTIFESPDYRGDTEDWT